MITFILIWLFLGWLGLLLGTVIHDESYHLNYRYVSVGVLLGPITVIFALASHPDYSSKMKIWFVWLVGKADYYVHESIYMVVDQLKKWRR